jgi:mono/diheme cytochrome c family protein
LEWNPVRTTYGGIVVPALLAGVMTMVDWSPVSPDRFEIAVLAPHEDTIPVQDPDGEKLYKDECSFCHGDKGRGDGRLGRDMNPRPPDISDPSYLDETSEEEIIKVIAEGAGDMGAYDEFFGEPEMRAILAYMKQLGDERREDQGPTVEEDE